MRKATAVIGSNFGDEGKGLITDFLVSQTLNTAQNTVVVRYCGGANAGHTVVEPSGRRHVFHHFGSGTFLGASTYLSQHFLVNPFLWEKELIELQQIGVSPNVNVHPRALLTTPYDMLINQELERSRAFTQSGVHGSCGVGINETVRRNNQQGGALFFSDINDQKTMKTLLQNIRDYYIPMRFKELNLTISPFARDLIYSDHLLENFLNTCREMYESMQMIFPKALNSLANDVVFEGSQGLLLDRDQHKSFPHVTNAKTGLHNVVEIAKQIGYIKQFDTLYITRPYLTRHGAGFLPCEDKALRHADNTNVDHEFQGSLRFGWLNLKTLGENIREDVQSAGGITKSAIVMTHLDQVGDAIIFVNGCCLKENLHKHVLDQTGLELTYTSDGPTRKNVKPNPNLIRNQT